MNKDYIYKRRLLKLADFLYELPPTRFAYESWVGESWEGKPDLSCGTTACAFGWATTIPSFRKLGLRLKPNRSEGRAHVTLKDFSGWSARFENAPRLAARKIFGLDTDEFEYLFVPNTASYNGNIFRRSPSENASAKKVAAHIRKFVKRKYNRAKAQ